MKTKDPKDFYFTSQLVGTPSLPKGDRQLDARSTTALWWPPTHTHTHTLHKKKQTVMFLFYFNQIHDTYINPLEDGLDANSHRSHLLRDRKLFFSADLCWLHRTVVIELDVNMFQLSPTGTKINSCWIVFTTYRQHKCDVHLQQAVKRWEFAGAVIFRCPQIKRPPAALSVSVLMTGDRWHRLNPNWVQTSLFGTACRGFSGRVSSHFITSTCTLFVCFCLFVC